MIQLIKFIDVAFNCFIIGAHIVLIFALPYIVINVIGKTED